MKVKKFFVYFMFVALLVVSGCTPVEQGNYKAGIYYGTAIDSYGGENNTATAVVYVNEEGVIESLFLDTTYVKDGVITTKKALGSDYGMKDASASIANIPGGAEWYEQVNNLENKVIAEQGLDWLIWSDEANTITDSVSGVTIKINALVEALNNALNQAK